MSKNPNNIEISGRLKSFGETHFKSQTEFAAALDMVPQTLQNYLNGKSKPGNKLQERLRALGCKTQAEYKTQEEHSEIAKLKEGNERYRAENEAFRRSLSPLVVRVVLEAAKKEQTRGAGNRKK